MFNEKIKPKLLLVEDNKDQLYNLKNFLEQDYEEFQDFLKETQATICGQLPIKILIKLLNHFNEKIKIKGELLDYYTSGDVIGDYDNVVGYAGIIFIKED